MPLLDIRALQDQMTRRNVLFKHQLANLVGISYDRLTQIIADGDADVDDDTVRRLCTGLDCDPADITHKKKPPPATG